jgi:fluoride exporter
MPKLFLLVFLFGGLGSCLRYGLSGWVASWAGAAFPYGTLLVNVTGCFLIGLLAGLPAAVVPPTVRIAAISGFLGGLTTFSAFEYESFTLLLNGEASKAMLNLGGSVVLGLLCLVVGYRLARLVGAY